MRSFNFLVTLVIACTSSTLEVPSVEFVSVCENPLISESSQCAFALRMRDTIASVVALYERVKSNATIQSFPTVPPPTLSPVDGVLMDSKISMFVNGDHDQELQIAALAKLSSSFLVEKVFQRFLNRTVDDCRINLDGLLNVRYMQSEAKTKGVALQLRTHEKRLTQMRHEIAAREKENDLHALRYKVLSRLIRNYEISAQNEPEEYYTYFSMYKKLVDRKFENLRVCSEDEIQGQVRDIVDLFLSLKTRGMNHRGLWMISRHALSTIPAPVVVLSPEKIDQLSSTAKELVTLMDSLAKSEESLSEWKKLSDQLRRLIDEGV
jgi:hypothetical protein